MPTRTVQVLPNPNHPSKLSEEKLRKHLSHPVSGGFPPEGPATWKFDQFTYRRIRDGDVVTVGDPRDMSAKPQPALRHQSHTATPKT